MASFLYIAILPLLSFYVISCSAGRDEFNEELFFKTLPSGHIYGHFQFVTTWNVTLQSPGSKHYHLFPRALGEVFETYSVKELHLTFTQGRWRHESWGFPVIDASSGAELLVWFQAHEINVDETWLGLINVLSGMFCASLNFMDARSTIVPAMSFRQSGATSDTYERHFDKYVRHAILPSENVCTENLTPWKKLLPCGLKAGLSTLLVANKLYDASYHSLGIHFRHVCISEDCTQVGLELSQTLAVVFDPIINLRTPTQKPDWSFKRLFGRMINSACPLASVSKVFIDVTDAGASSVLNPQPTYVAEKIRDGVGLKYAVYDIPRVMANSKVFNLDVKHPNSGGIESKILPPFITTNRFQTGQGQVFGGVMCLIYNRHPTKSIPSTYLEVIPHYLRTYLHTLKIESFQGEIGDVESAGKEVKPLKIHYVPGLDSGRPYHLEVAFRLPANSITRISFQFERQLLKWTDYPPDANHGFPVASSVLSVLLPSTENVTSPSSGQTLIGSIFENESSGDAQGYFVRIYTEPLLVMLPTPDFSMPYNVICLVCTVIAIAFGSVHNLTTKSFVRYDPEKHKNIFMKIKDKIWRKKGQNVTTTST